MSSYIAYHTLPDVLSYKDNEYHSLYKKGFFKDI